MSADVMEAVRETLDDSGIPYRRLSSGAGHDTQLMSQIANVGMIFTSSRGGISHSPLEDTDPRALGEGGWRS